MYTPLKQKSQAWILTLTDPMAGRVRGMLAQASRDGIEAVVVEGWRSPHRQRALYAKGQTRAKPWVSQHQWGLAVDIVPLDNQVKLWWYAPLSVWNQLGRIGELHGLRWGGRFIPPDRGHFEFPIEGSRFFLLSGVMLGILSISVRGINRCCQP
jgi:peptidoglycan L-alanyl-D-glutamate endopeptidase CwlK